MYSIQFHVVTYIHMIYHINIYIYTWDSVASYCQSVTATSELRVDHAHGRSQSANRMSETLAKQPLGLSGDSRNMSCVGDRPK